MGKVGVLALQGDYAMHARALERAGATVVEVRTAAELEAVEGLVIPGGESSTMLKLLNRENLFEPLRMFGASRPIFGTCAGAILMASHVLNPEQASLGLMDLTVERNAYGRQLDSRVVKLAGAEIDAKVLAHGAPEMEAVFIRAPIIRKAGDGVQVLASFNGDPVLAEQGPHLVATFHPELSHDDRVHAYFLGKLKR